MTEVKNDVNKTCSPRLMFLYGNHKSIFEIEFLHVSHLPFQKFDIEFLHVLHLPFQKFDIEFSICYI